MSTGGLHQPDVSPSTAYTVTYRVIHHVVALAPLTLKSKVAFQYMLLIQGDTSRWFKPPVGSNLSLTLKQKFCFDVNGRFEPS